MSETVSETLEDRCRDLEKTIKNIVAVGYGGGTPAHRMLKMLDIAEKAELALSERVGGIPAR